MTELILFPRPPRRKDPRRVALASRKTLICSWTVCPTTGALACHWEVVGGDPTIAPATPREREQPPSPIRLAA